jgi:hypothetical protein
MHNPAAQACHLKEQDQNKEEKNSKKNDKLKHVP